MSRDVSEQGDNATLVGGAHHDCSWYLGAEGEGFEPSMRVHRIRDFQSRALGQLCDPS